MSDQDLELRGLPVGHLPVIRACLELLGVRDVLEQRLPKHPLAKVSDGECVIAMVLNILSGRVALWRMDEHLKLTDVELLIGEGVEPKHFHDTRLGQALDRLDAEGTDSLLSEIVLRYLKTTDSDPFSAHLDTTSLSLEGAYIDAPEPTPKHGFSKDLRPDLKQLIFGLLLHGRLGVPLTMSVSSGNTSDQAANRDHLTRLAALLPNPADVTIVADCKLVDAATLGMLTGAGFHFVSLLPGSFALRTELIDRAWAAVPDPSAWPLLAERPGATKTAAPQRYTGMSFNGDIAMRIGDVDGAKSSVERMRCLVVRSDRLAAKFEASLEDKLKREQDRLESDLQRAIAKEFACETDARAAAAPLMRRLKLLSAEVGVKVMTRTPKRPQRGRPAADAPPPEPITTWVPEVTFRRNEAAIDEARRHASCFVLVTDWACDEWDDQRVLAEYRYQALVEGHTGFRWLKGPAAVTPMFLNTPTRIRALGFVFMLALMVRNFIQFTLRAAMKERGRGIKHPFRKADDAKLTMEMALVWFAPMVSTFMRRPGGEWRRGPPTFQPEALDILSLLGIGAHIYSTPPPRGK